LYAVRYFPHEKSKGSWQKKSSTQIIYSGLIMNQIEQCLWIWGLWSSEGRISLRTHNVHSGSSYWCHFPSEICQVSNKHYSVGSGCFC